MVPLRGPAGWVGWILGGLGFLLGHLPEPFLKHLCGLIGWLAYHGLAGRRKISLQNLARAFPGRTLASHQQVAKKSFIRLVEMGCFLLLLPIWSLPKWRKRFQLSESTKKFLGHAPQSTLLLIPHFCLNEAFCLGPALFSPPLPGWHVLFRPLRSRGLNQWLRHTREYFGIRLLSRKEGLLTAHRVLSHQGHLALLFDQNAGPAGRLIPFLGHLASTTPLPAQLWHRHRPAVYWGFVRRTGFLRGILEVEKVPASVLQGNGEDLLTASNQWLGHLLATDPESCAGWLWSHRRWQLPKKPSA